MEATKSSDEYVIVCEWDRTRIETLRSLGYCVVKVAPNHFGDSDGLVLVRRG